MLHEPLGKQCLQWNRTDTVSTRNDWQYTLSGYRTAELQWSESMRTPGCMALGEGVSMPAAIPGVIMGVAPGVIDGVAPPIIGVAEGPTPIGV